MIDIFTVCKNILLNAKIVLLNIPSSDLKIFRGPGFVSY